MIKLLCAILCLAALPASAKKEPAADALATFTISIKPRGAGPAYVNLHDGKAYEEKEAAAHKADLDFVYLVTRDASSVKRELFNLSGKDTQLAAEVLGTQAGIVALSWDDDLVAKCVTVADLKRMTGSYTPNSFSFYGTLANNAKGELDNKRYIFLDSHGRMGIFTIKQGAGDELILEVKITP
jgi:hypothetical protein